MTLKRLLGFFTAFMLIMPALAQQEAQQQDLEMRLERFEQQIFMLQQRISELEVMLGQRLVELERQQTFDRLRRDLEGLRTQIEAAEDPEGTATALAQIRENIGLQFARAGVEAQERWAQLNERFRSLEEQVRQGDPAAVTVLDEILAGYHRDTQVAFAPAPPARLLGFERHWDEEFWQQLVVEPPIDRANVLVQAEQFLRTVRHDLERGRATDLTLEGLGWVRTVIAAAYVEVEPDVEVEEPELEARGAELTAQLEMLEEQLRDGDPAAIETYERVLESVREVLEAERAPTSP